MEENTSSDSYAFFQENLNNNRNNYYETTCTQLLRYYASVYSFGTRVKAPLYNTYSQKVGDYCKIIQKGSFSDKVYITDDDILKLSFTGGTKRIDFTTSNGNTTITLDKLYNALWIQNKYSGNKIIIPDHFFFDGATFTINLEFKDENGIAISNAYGADLFTIPQSQGNGQFKITYFKEQSNFKWVRICQATYV